MSVRTKPALPAWRDLEEQLFARFVRVPLILSQQLPRDEALVLSYLLNHRRVVGMSSPLAIDGRFWIVKAQIVRDLQLSPHEQRAILDDLRKQRFLKFDDEPYRRRWSISLRASIRFRYSSSSKCRRLFRLSRRPRASARIENPFEAQMRAGTITSAKVPDSVGVKPLGNLLVQFIACPRWQFLQVANSTAVNGGGSCRDNQVPLSAVWSDDSSTRRGGRSFWRL